MPVNKLLVEGKLDGQLLNPILAGYPVLESDCPKGSLGPRCLDQRTSGIPNVCYLRDRDYDSEPGATRVEPVVHREYHKAPLGWNWCRHSIENYMLEPNLVNQATGLDVARYTTALIGAGKSIRHYQIARWSIGKVKRELPPITELSGRPLEFGGDFRIPDDLSETATSIWARSVVTTFRQNIATVIEPAAFDSILADYASKLTDQLFSTCEMVLLWCSGKDLFTALSPWLIANKQGDAAGFRNTLRDWIIAHPDETLEMLPEWKHLRSLLRN